MTTTIPEVAAAELVTAGRTQHLVTCPRCGSLHRHLDVGPRRGPCGARYTITTREDPTL
ncbi:hypothetical protein ACH40F_29170 [Streptomyces sp. NPDC020794]|uniref:hypothetical protein n=1 Tax=unclassified Streptomyces TaxID=2593676 RepID=UPI0036E0CC1B